MRELGEKKGSPGRRRERGDRNRALILAESVSIASLEGLEALTIGGVANAAGVPKSTLQVLFGDRESLQLETLQRGAERFEAEIRRAIKPAETALGRLIALIEAWFDVVNQRVLPGGCLVTAVANEFRLRSGVLGDAVRDHRRRWRDALAEGVAAAKAEGGLRQGVDVDDLVFEIMAYQSAANSTLLSAEAGDSERAKRLLLRRLDEAAAAT